MYPNFHQAKMENLRLDDLFKETRAARIDEMANDLYAEKLAGLPNGQPGSEYRQQAGYNIYSALSEIDNLDLVLVARAIIANDEAEVGRLIIKLVTAQLRKDAQNEADDYDDEHNGID